MGFIYKISNDINQKVYVGKTEKSIQKRFQEHCNDAFKRTEERRPLYAAMRKYGIKHFKVEELDTALTADELCRKEIYWIGKLNSYEDGYNATLGGDGKSWFNHDLILEYLQQDPYPISVAEKIGCSSDLVREIAKDNNIAVKNRGMNNVQIPKQIE